jgi:hypothetical protein
LCTLVKRAASYGSGLFRRRITAADGDSLRWPAAEILSQIERDHLCCGSIEGAGVWGAQRSISCFFVEQYKISL